MRLLPVIAASLIGATIPALAAKLVPPGANVMVTTCHSQFGMMVGKPQGGVAIVRQWQPSKGEFGKPKVVDTQMLNTSMDGE